MEPRTERPKRVKIVQPSPSMVFQAKPPSWDSFQPPVGLDLLDHGAECIYMGSQGARAVVTLGRPGWPEARLCVLRESLSAGNTLKGLLGQGDGRFSQPGGDWEY